MNFSYNTISILKVAYKTIIGETWSRAHGIYFKFVTIILEI